jgi:hypothetical protein
LNGKQRAVAPAPTMKTAETKSNSLLGRIDIGLRHRIEGLAPAGGAKGVKPMMKGFKGTTAQQQKVCVLGERTIIRCCWLTMVP